MKRLFACAALVACSAAALLAAPAVKLSTVDGRTIDPFQMANGAKAVVFLFASVDCPISNRYAPVVKQLNAAFAPKGVVFWLVYPNPFDTPDAVRAHLKAFSYENGALLDPDHALAKLAQASVTPEAAIFDRDGRELYHGRIDDRYVSLTVERPSPTRHDLEDALSAVVAGRPVAAASTTAVGCFISDFVR